MKETGCEGEEKKPCVVEDALDGIEFVVNVFPEFMGYPVGGDNVF